MTQAYRPGIGEMKPVYNDYGLSYVKWTELANQVSSAKKLTKKAEDKQVWWLYLGLLIGLLIGLFLGAS